MAFRRLLLAAALNLPATCAAELADPLAGTFPATENDVSLLQKSLHLGGDLEQAREQPEHKPVPTLYVDLDVAPEKRWRNVTRYYTDMGLFPKLWQVSQDDIPPESKALLASLKFSEEHMRELRGIVDDFSHIINDPKAALDAITLAQVGYELSGAREGNAGAASPDSGPLRSATILRNFSKLLDGTGCSGLLAAMLNGTVVHIRNMDYAGFEVEVDGKKLHWPDVTVDVTFLRSGKPLYTGVQWPGLIGVHTGTRHGGWSFEQNTRFHNMDSSYIWGFRGSHGYMLEVRKVMETVPDFETAVTTLRELNLMAPGFFVVAGPKPYQGAVITMDRGGTHEPITPPVLRLGSTGPELQALKLTQGQRYTRSWHIIQTNDDRNKVALDDRRPAAELRLAECTQDMVDVDWAFSLMTEAPLYSDLTVFTTVFVPSWDYHKTFVHPEHIR